MKRILIAAALCLVSFQSYAESEMTFKEFGDVIYSEDQSAYFMRYTDTAVNKQKVMKALRYSAGTYGDANGFRDACLAKCAGKEKCGGVVFQYHNTDKATPKKCNFKALEPTTKTNKQKKKDFYRRVCYDGGPGGYPSADDERACELFGKTIVKTASGTIVAPTTCNDGDPYTKANDQACYAAGKAACWRGAIKDGSNRWVGTPDDLNHWVVTSNTENVWPFCWRFCAASDACYGGKPNVLADFPVGHICKSVAHMSHMHHDAEIATRYHDLFCDDRP